MPAKPKQPDYVLPLLPLRGMLVFPHMVTSLEVGRSRSLLAVEAAMLRDKRYLILAAQRDAQKEEPETEDIYPYGALVEVKQLLRLPEERVRVLVAGICRVRITNYNSTQPYYEVAAVKVKEPVSESAEVRALVRTTANEFNAYLKLTKKSVAEAGAPVHEITDPGILADVIAAQLNITLEERQKLLEVAAPAERIEAIYAILLRETDLLELERRIQERVRKQMEKAQREYYLREQIKAIQKELGETDDRTAEIEEYKKKLIAGKLPKEAHDKVLHELDRLERMPPMAAEAVVIRNYLDWLLSVPWQKRTKERHDIKLAEQVLNADHYGLETVKERILEFLAVRQLVKRLPGPILCLVGPPGVGKTSLARSIATAMGRRFYRFSLGGVRDEAEIRGHRRTYIGAMPGKLIQAMCTVGVRNPVILLDEVDKMSADFRGDPASALLEVLDTEQNSRFGDHYLEVTYDMSDVLFITTANVLSAIPRPLRDRMEVIQIPGYTEDEKVEIAKRHLLPKQIEQHGLDPEQLVIRDRLLRTIIGSYTREAGVRQIERALAAICRKAAREIVSNQKEQVKLTQRMLQKYLGKPRYHHAAAENRDRVGVATGLAYTDVGGEILEIEVTVVPGRGRLLLTGKLGEVMRESAQAAFSFVRSRAEDLGIDSDFNEKHDIHVHVPEGAIPKDGPSAGITIAVALASALSKRPVLSNWAMTGEITLRGRVLAIGGVKEKVLAAHRAGVSHIILPQENERDMEDIPVNVRRQLEFTFADHVDKVLDMVLGPKIDEDMEKATAQDPEPQLLETDVSPSPEWSTSNPPNPAQ
ncbi:MAG: endopeptidase La [Limnochordia bacterium]